ncbi:long-chain acyl-CoA synthetase [Thalassotalea loyana]|uniref:Long-chain acyl-CoA synthetase n=1 Tax=Thalassotalea loyana TaxID=280483 RepID=A0ABQ6H7G2_9GAMM|nr:long-chain acyl-CoA synthetase [Thalassotalea loyana]
MILKAIFQNDPNSIAIETQSNTVSYEELFSQVERVYYWLVEHNVNVLVLESDNVPEWVYIDLACQKAGVVFVPVPSFFSKSQVDSVIARVEPDVIIQPVDNSTLWETFIFPIYQFSKFKHSNKNSMPKGTSKVTFTSGSTGQPKGVCLSIENQFKVANSLVKRIGLKQPKHFCLLSFSTLLENIAGIYAPLMAGGTICIYSDNERGFNGSSITSPDVLLNTISSVKPETIILVPELLQFLLHANSSGWQLPDSFKFMAVGGSRVAPSLLAKATTSGFPVFQGYGLSECASVVALNSSEAINDFSAGEALPHLSVEVINGELVVKGNAFLGYLGLPETWYQQSVRTGDIASITNGRVEINGRKSNLLINSFGRNISPEWVESELLGTNAFSQVVVFGDAQPSLVALVSPINRELTNEFIATVINKVNQSLPDYARIKHFHTLEQPLSIESGQLTSNGRPKRNQILNNFSQEMAALYRQSSEKEINHEII